MWVVKFTLWLGMAAALNFAAFPQTQACVTAWVKREFSFPPSKPFLHYATRTEQDEFSAQLAEDGSPAMEVNNVQLRAPAAAAIPLAVWGWLGLPVCWRASPVGTAVYRDASGTSYSLSPITTLAGLGDTLERPGSIVFGQETDSTLLADDTFKDFDATSVWSGGLSQVSPTPADGAAMPRLGSLRVIAWWGVFVQVLLWNLGSLTPALISCLKGACSTGELSSFPCYDSSLVAGWLVPGATTAASVWTSIGSGPTAAVVSGSTVICLCDAGRFWSATGGSNSFNCSSCPAGAVLRLPRAS
jgi:hypothetical protein